LLFTFFFLDFYLLFLFLSFLVAERLTQG